jgi:hypothetical protein
VFLKHISNSAEIALAGNDAERKLLGLVRRLTYLNTIPYIYKANSNLPIASYPVEEGLFKLCLGKSCQLPTPNPEDIENHIANERPFGNSHKDLPQE